MTPPANPTRARIVEIPLVDLEPVKLDFRVWGFASEAEMDAAFAQPDALTDTVELTTPLSGVR